MAEQKFYQVQAWQDFNKVREAIFRLDNSLESSLALTLP